MINKKNKLSSEKKFENNWWSYWIDKYIMPNGNEGEYHYCHTEGSAFTVPLLDDEHVLMLKQYRYLTGRISLEFPGGGIREGQNRDDIARKELIEETGYEGDFEFIGSFNPFIGATDEFCHVYIARNLKENNEFFKDDSEDLEVVKIRLDELDDKISSNEIFNGMTMAMWSMVRKKLLK